jgi:hypothetical protein
MSSGKVTLHTAGEQPTQEMPTVSVVAPTPGSIVAKLRERAKAQQEARTTEIPVGGEFGDRLFIKYGVLKPDEMDRFVSARAGTKIQDISATSATMDMMARACICLVGRYGDEEEELADENGVIRLEDRLARLLDLRGPAEPVLSSYEVISRLFGRNGAAITDHGDKLATWMTDPATSETEEPGEF